LYLERLDLIETQMAALEKSVADALHAHQEAVTRLVEIPGLGVDSAQQIIAEIGPQAVAFPSAAQLASWIGVCPGRQESAGESSSNRSAKGNRTMRRLLNQLAHAAVRKDGCYLNVLFHRWLPRMGYKKAIWAIAHRLCRLIWKVLHDGVRYIEKGVERNAKALKERRRRLVAELQRLGYHVELTAAPGSPSDG
jgi:transposase